MSIAFLTTDLLFLSRVTSQAQALGIPMRIVRNGEALIQLGSEQPLQLVILDLSTKGWEVVATVSALKASNPSPHIVAYGPHVDSQTLANAKNAGCDEVLTKGQFDRTIAEILRKWLEVSE